MAAAKLTLDQALEKWDGASGWSTSGQADIQRARILERFPIESWSSLDVERYALGTGDKDTFCYLMEFASPGLGGIGGGSARKHMIYRKSDTGEWWYDKRYASIEEAWAGVRTSFLEVFAAAASGDMDSIESIEPMGRLTIGAKAAFLYFPDRLVPIYSSAALGHFWPLLGGQGDVGIGATGAARVLEQARKQPRLAEATPLDIGHFLYWWADPREARRVVKISPGPDGKYWDDCRAGGYVCIGWDDVPNLTDFESKDEFKARFREVYPSYGAAKLSAKVNEVWTLRELEPGDLVVANKGASRVLALGTVVDPGYEWRPDREEFKHTVRVDWDDSYAQTIDPIRSWPLVTVAKVPYTLLHRIEKGRGSSGSAGAGVGTPDDTQLDVPVDPVFGEIAGALNRKGQVIIYGPPGTGKTYSANRFAVWWLRRLDEVPAASSVLADSDMLNAADATYAAPAGLFSVGRLTRVTFHPSYTYEDFVEGYRPVDTGQDSSFCG